MRLINFFRVFTFLFFVFFINGVTIAQDSLKTRASDSRKDTIYVFSINQNIEPSAWRLTKKAFANAKKHHARYLIVKLNTYGGLVNIADSIRTKFLDSPIPVVVFIENNAASAGALISIAADSIYMKKGARIGAASVVNQEGEIMPEKYQSYMRSTMRATAQAHGKDTIVRGNDTILKWHRNPDIAEAMVDPSLSVEGVNDSGKIVTFTTEEAIKYGYCEGRAKDLQEVIDKIDVENPVIKEYKPSRMESIIGFLINPGFQSILIMIIVGGIYFELQSPGVGFPLLAAICAAALYFAPLYIEGLAENWEILLFVGGLVLIAVELFAIPGFGVAGIAGILLTVTGLVLSMIDNIVFDYQFNTAEAFRVVLKSFLIVSVSIFISLVLSLYISKKVFHSKAFSSLVLDSTQKKDEGYIGVDSEQTKLVGKTGIAYTVLRPSGKVEIEGEIYDARSEIGFIDKGEKVKVLSYGTSQLSVIKPDEDA